MRKLTIDPEYKDLLPKQTAEERAALTESILADGCRDVIIVDENDVIIDGHNRYEICTEHNVEFQTVVKRFESRDDVKLFIYQNQLLMKRNMTDEQRAKCICDMYELQKKMHGGQGSNQYTVQRLQNEVSAKPQRTSDIISKKTGLSAATVERNVRFGRGLSTLSAVDKEAEETILSGKSGVTMGAVAQMTKLHEEEIKEAAQKIKEGRGKEVVQMMKEKEAEKKLTKTCSRCKRTLSVDDFYKGRNVCKECDAETKEWSEYMGAAESVSQRQQERELSEKVYEDVRSLDREFTYDADDAAQEITATAETFARQLRYMLQHHKELIRSAPQKIIAALSEAEAAIVETKEICS